MGQYKSYNESNLEKQLVDIEQDLIKIKATQQYDFTQMNMSYDSGEVKVTSYYVWENVTDIYGICARFIFTSPLRSPAPRAEMTVRNALTTVGRVTKLNENSLEFLMSIYTNGAQDVFFSVKSNVKGDLRLDKTYVYKTVVI